MILEEREGRSKEGKKGGPLTFYAVQEFVVFISGWVGEGDRAGDEGNEEERVQLSFM